MYHYLGRQVQLVYIVMDFGQDVLQAQTLQSFQLAHLAGGEQISLKLVSPKLTNIKLYANHYL